MIYRAPQSPPPGIYECTGCGRRITINEDRELPGCSHCRSAAYYRVGPLGRASTQTEHRESEREKLRPDSWFR